MFKYFNSQLFGDYYDDNEYQDSTIEEDYIIDADIIKQIEPFLDDDIDKPEEMTSLIPAKRHFYYNNVYKKKNNKNKKKKMKNYNIKKGDWQCPKCDNINFSFRTKCNICNEEKCKNQI